MKHRWTKEQIEFLELNYQDYGANYCAEKFNCSTRRVRIKASRLGIVKLKQNLDYRVCRCCFKKKKVSEFSPHSGCKLGRQSKCKSCRADWESDRKITDKTYRIIHSIRNRIRIAIKKNVKSSSSFNLLGCNISFLKEYLSKKFISGMSWENHGLWHIDHIIPCSSFNLALESEQKKCFHYTNLQPLWAKDNLSKGSCVNKTT